MGNGNEQLAAAMSCQKTVIFSSFSVFLFLKKASSSPPPPENTPWKALKLPLDPKRERQRERRRGCIFGLARAEEIAGGISTRKRGVYLFSFSLTPDQRKKKNEKNLSLYLSPSSSSSLCLNGHIPPPPLSPLPWRLLKLPPFSEVEKRKREGGLLEVGCWLNLRNFHHRPGTTPRDALTTFQRQINLFVLYLQNVRSFFVVFKNTRTHIQISNSQLSLIRTSHSNQCLYRSPYLSPLMTQFYSFLLRQQR